MRYFFLALAIGFCLGVVLDRIQCRTIVLSVRKQREKFFIYFEVLDRWLEILESSKSIIRYFEKKGYKQIAIYGIGVLGMHLIKQLETTNVKINYAIDRNAQKMKFDISVLTMEEDFPQVDVIVVTPVQEFDVIRDKLREKTDIEIISLEDIIYDND